MSSELSGFRISWARCASNRESSRCFSSAASLLTSWPRAWERMVSMPVGRCRRTCRSRVGHPPRRFNKRNHVSTRARDPRATLPEGSAAGWRSARKRRQRAVEPKNRKSPEHETHFHRPPNHRDVPTLTAKHLCSGCRSTIEMVGQGKGASRLVKHTCSAWGDESVFCCGPAGAGKASTGMEKH